MYRELDPERIVETSEQLQKRVEERFPGSSLSRIAVEVTSVVRVADQVSAWLARPILWVRVAVAVLRSYRIVYRTDGRLGNDALAPMMPASPAARRACPCA